MKKKKYEENRGLTGRGTDYSTYRMSVPEVFIGAAAGAAAGCAAFSIFFGMMPLAAAAGLGGLAAGVRTAKKYFQAKRDRNLMIQFRDFLESLSSSLSAGQNISGALETAGGDMKLQYGEKSLMAVETGLILSGIRNNITAEKMLEDFAERSGQRDVRTFSETFSICTRTGGNMRNVILRTTGLLSEKMQTEAETEVIASKGKNELLIMTVMPFIIVPMLRTLGESGVSGNNPVTVAVKILGAMVIAAAYMAGRKITDIKI